MTLTLTETESRALRMLLLGEICQYSIEERHRRIWRQIVRKIETEQRKEKS